MADQLTLEELATKLDSIHKTANTLKADVEEIKERDHPKHEAQDDDDHKDPDKKEAKKGQDEDKEEEKKEARNARYKAMKKAMDEDDEEKRDAAMKRAMEVPTHTLVDNDKEKTAEDDEEKKEHDAAVASIITDKRSEFIDKILSANKIFNAADIKNIEKRVKKASLTALKKEWKTIEPFIAAQSVQPTKAEVPVIPYYASFTSDDVDASQLNASSPDSEFAKLSTKELLEMAN